MLRYALVFFAIALAGAALGLSGVAGAAGDFAWLLFVVFAILALASYVRGLGRVA